MHDIEPYFNWRAYYSAESDNKSPFFGQTYSEFQFSNKVYNYFIHPQWDSMGSPTLYIKIIFADYDEGFAFIELIGEWNDCLNNDIMFLKRYIVDVLIKNDIYKFVLLCDNVLNFHASDNCYYEEWWDDIKDDGGWICIINTLDHVLDEMEGASIHHYCNIGEIYQDLNWRKKSPKLAFSEIDFIRQNAVKQIH